MKMQTITKKAGATVAAVALAGAMFPGTALAMTNEYASTEYDKDSTTGTATTHLYLQMGDNNGMATTSQQAASKKSTGNVKVLVPVALNFVADNWGHVNGPQASIINYSYIPTHVSNIKANQTDYNVLPTAAELEQETLPANKVDLTIKPNYIKGSSTWGGEKEHLTDFLATEESPNGKAPITAIDLDAMKPDTEINENQSYPGEVEYYDQGKKTANYRRISFEGNYYTLEQIGGNNITTGDKYEIATIEWTIKPGYTPTATDDEGTDAP